MDHNETPRIGPVRGMVVAVTLTTVLFLVVWGVAELLVMVSVSVVARSRWRPDDARGRMTTTRMDQAEHTRFRRAVRPETFGERLRRLRLERGITSAELSEASGIADSTIRQNQRRDTS